MMNAPIVMGVDGTIESTHAVGCAMLEAERVGCGLQLVHATPNYVPLAPLLPTTTSSRSWGVASPRGQLNRLESSPQGKLASSR